MKTPNVNRTEYGQKLVDILAFGCIQFMIDNGIEISDDGFESLVERSREEGLNGRIAFQMYDWTQQKMQNLFIDATKLPSMPVSGDRVHKIRQKQSLRNRLLAIGLDPLDETISEEETRRAIDSVRRHMGEHVADLIEALRYGDCQRDLVKSRINELCADDVKTALEEYKKM